MLLQSIRPTPGVITQAAAAHTVSPAGPVPLPSYPLSPQPHPIAAPPPALLTCLLQALLSPQGASSPASACSCCAGVYWISSARTVTCSSWLCAVSSCGPEAKGRTWGIKSTRSCAPTQQLLGTVPCNNHPQRPLSAHPTPPQQNAS